MLSRKRNSKKVVISRKTAFKYMLWMNIYILTAPLNSLTDSVFFFLKKKEH